MTPKPFRIIPCVEWGAKPVSLRPFVRYDKAIFHATAGHHPELDANHSTESYEESKAYAQAIQNLHMTPPRNWHDTGNNFLVTRNGYIFEGRHGSARALAQGKMPVSAHCPGQNGEDSPNCGPGVEIEHNGTEDMTPIQWEAAVWLFAKICKAGGFGPEKIQGHRDYFATSCPGSLYGALPAFRADVAVALKPAPKPKPKPKTTLYVIAATDSKGKTKTVRSKTPWLTGGLKFGSKRFDLKRATIQRVEN